MRHQHLFRTGRNEPKEIENEVLMNETRTDSKKLPNACRKRWQAAEKNLN